MRIGTSAEIGAIIDDTASVSIREGQHYVGVEHLFEVMVNKANLLPRPIAVKYLKTLREVLAAVHEAGWKGKPPQVDGNIFYTPRCAELTEEATRLAKHLRSGEITSIHLLLAIFSDPHAAPSRAANRLRLDREAIVKDLRQALLGDTGMKGKSNLALPTTAALDGRALEGGQEEPEVTLESFTHDLTQDARDGDLKPAIGRDKEVMEVIQVLNRKEKNNVILVGEPGVGKTKVVEGLAVDCATGVARGIAGGQAYPGTEYRGADVGYGVPGRLREKAAGPSGGTGA